MPTSALRVSVSVVSHRQAGLVEKLLDDLDRRCTTEFEVLLTINLPEPQSFATDRYRFPVRLISNAAPKGFGANHNAAFRESRYELFCVLNPDVRLDSDPFPALAQRLQQPGAGVVAPLVRSADGVVETTARPFPTPLFIVRKALFGQPPPAYGVGQPDIRPDWVGGMFMLLPREAFAAVGGFDERYHLYYEDVDLCARLRLARRDVVLCPTVEILHDARRESHRNLRYLVWHVRSMLRFFTSWPFIRLVLFRRV
jgi:GT2 family glycosyltransferase